jgi:excinuclease ABC subunit A
VLHELVDQGNTVIVIEHNLEVIKTADWIVDLGPEGGDAGGNVVAIGTPEDIAANAHSYTGQYLKQVIDRRRGAKAAKRAAAAAE